MKVQMKRKQSGMTLIEIMVVVAIIGVIMAMIVPAVVGKDDQARVGTAKSSIKSILNALDMYKLDNYSYPDEDQGIEALYQDPGDAKNWAKGGYLKKMPMDPWQNEYEYYFDGSSPEVVCLGSDGKEGGDGYAADISSNDI